MGGALALVVAALVWLKGSDRFVPSDRGTEGTRRGGALAGGSAASPASSERERPPAMTRPDGARAQKPSPLPSFVGGSRGRSSGGASSASGASPTSAARFSADVEGITAALRDALPQVKECYDAWLKVNPSLGGRVLVGFTLSRSKEAPDEGRISKATISQSSLGHAAMEGCVLSVVDDLRFEAPAEDVEVEFPMVMSAGDEPADGRQPAK